MHVCTRCSIFISAKPYPTNVFSSVHKPLKPCSCMPSTPKYLSCENVSARRGQMVDWLWVQDEDEFCGKKAKGGYWSIVTTGAVVKRETRTC